MTKYLIKHWVNVDVIAEKVVDELEIDITKNEIKNITKNQTYSMKPFPDLIGKIIEAGGLFKYKP